MREDIILRLEENNRLSIAGELDRNKNETSSSALERWVKDSGELGRCYQAAKLLTGPVVLFEHTIRKVLPSDKETCLELEYHHPLKEGLTRQICHGFGRVSFLTTGPGIASLRPMLRKSMSEWLRMVLGQNRRRCREPQTQEHREIRDMKEGKVIFVESLVSSKTGEGRVNIYLRGSGAPSFQLSIDEARTLARQHFPGRRGR